MRVRVIEKNGRFFPQKLENIETRFDLFNPRYEWKNFVKWRWYILPIYIEESFSTAEAAEQFLLKQPTSEPRVIKEFEI